jgi:eukaryotic-like serine/threonine-protein kinase
MAEVLPGQTLDQYQVEDVIARSGMATIFRARDLETGQTVVLKVPHIQFEADLVFHQRFQREEEIGLKLDHPGVIRVLRPEEKSRVYMAMELVAGELLRDRLRRESPLRIPTAVDIATKIADVLVYLHEHHVIHRDLKPENIMLLPDGGVKLMDFGIAVDTTQGKITWGGLSQSIGTPDYMAPEQIKGHRGDARTDLYSLGCILYEMLTGRVPFPSDNIYAAMHAKSESLPPAPRTLRPEISPQLEEIVLSLLERDPSNRPESAFEVREKLAHPASVVLVDRTHREEPRLPAGARLAAALVGLALLWGAFWWVASSLAK